MGRRITSGFNPTTLGNFVLNNSQLTLATVNDNITLEPSGTGTVELPANYLTRPGIGANSVLPKNYIDNNISPGYLFINLS